MWGFLALAVSTAIAHQRADEERTRVWVEIEVHDGIGDRLRVRVPYDTLLATSADLALGPGGAQMDLADLEGIADGLRRGQQRTVVRSRDGGQRMTVALERRWAPSWRDAATTLVVEVGSRREPDLDIAVPMQQAAAVLGMLQAASLDGRPVLGDAAGLGLHAVVGAIDAPPFALVRLHGNGTTIRIKTE